MIYSEDDTTVYDFDQPQPRPEFVDLSFVDDILERSANLNLDPR